MYNSQNFVLSLNGTPTINVVTGGTTSLLFTVQNKDLTDTLYNLSLTLTLGNYVELLSSSIEYTNSNGKIYNFVNIKDLAPNEEPFKFSITIKLKETLDDGSVLSFGDIVSCNLKASADTSPRGIYDFENEIIESTALFSVKAVKYIIHKETTEGLLLGKTYTSKIIIETAENASTLFNKLEDFLGNGTNYLGNLTINGYYSEALNNFQVIPPDNITNSFKIIWSNILIPSGTTVIISYTIKLNERYYLNGSSTGNYIEHGSLINQRLSFSVNNENLVYNYSITALELVINIALSKYKLDINDSLVYTIYFSCNLYHKLLGVSGYLTTSDGQLLNDTSIPMYSSKNIASSGITQVSWNVGNVEAGNSTSVTISGTIASKYTRNGLNIFTGDLFTVSSSCNAISSATSKIVTSSDNTSFTIDIPNVSKIITNYYYRDNSPKTSNILAPGDYVSYKSTYDSSLLKAPSKSIKLFDFYPYVLNDITNIQYDYSSNLYPGTGVVPIDPNGVLWFVNSIPGSQKFDINYKTQIGYHNNPINFLYNLFKMQVTNSSGTSYSKRSQIAFKMGKPDLSINKTASGNNPNKIKIGEVYSITISLKNNLTDSSTDAFDFTFTETLPNKVTLNTNSISSTIDNNTVNYDLSSNTILVKIHKLAPGSTFILKYDISINDTLGPNEKLSLTSSSTVPYTQSYDVNEINLLYDINPLNSILTLRSEPIQIQLYSDSPSKIVGEIVYYNLSITIAQGQWLNSLSSLILVPALQSYLDEAWLNNVPITATKSNNTIIFPTILNINTTVKPLVLNYKIKCVVTNSIVSTTNKLYTIENIYGNLNYIDKGNLSVNMGISSIITINHPYVTLSIGSSKNTTNFSSPYLTDDSNTLYTRVLFNNISFISSKNINSLINIPNYLNFQSIVSYSNGINASYNNTNRTLSITIDNIDKQSNKFIIFKSNIDNRVLAENKLIIIGHVERYFNSISTTKIYSSDSISNNEIYIKSLLLFKPLSFYSLVGSDSAINLSRPGEPTEIKYILTNIGQGIDSYRLDMTAIDYEYDLYINSTFIRTITQNTTPSILSNLLNNIAPRNSIYITLKYTIPIDETAKYYNSLLVKVTSLNNPNSNKIVPTTLQDP